jgi:DNA-directed RNA polymerase specialized sigma24 family protein
MNSAAPIFATTHWSVVLAAGQSADAQASEALEQLCRTYWYPLYVFVRRQGRSPEDAQDLTQGFFAQLLRKDFLSGVGPEKGRFRSFLLACLNHFLSDERDRAQALKRGRNQPTIPLDADLAEKRYRGDEGEWDRWQERPLTTGPRTTDFRAVGS